MALSVENLTAFALPLRSIDILASVMPTSSHNSFEVIPRRFNASSSLTIIAILIHHYHIVSLFSSCSAIERFKIPAKIITRQTVRIVISEKSEAYSTVSPNSNANNSIDG